MKPNIMLRLCAKPHCSGCEQFNKYGEDSDDPNYGWFSYSKCETEHCESLIEYLHRKSSNPAYIIEKGDTKLNVVDIAGVPTPLEVINPYINHIIQRIKEANIPQEDFMLELGFDERLEFLRRELHVKILNSVGFGIWDISPESWIYRVILEKYIELRVYKTGLIGEVKDISP